MKVKDIIPLIDESIIIWISGHGSWTMPRKDLLECDGERLVSKITVGSTKIWEEDKKEWINESGSKCSNSWSGYKEHQTMTLWLQQ